MAAATTPRKTTPTRSRKTAQATNAAKAKPAADTKPEFIIIEDALHFRSKRAGEFVLNLDLTFGAVLDIQDMEDARDPDEEPGIREVHAIFAAVCDDEDTVLRARKLTVTELTRLVARFMDEVAIFQSAAEDEDLEPGE